MDRPIYSDARACLAGRLSTYRLRSAQGDAADKSAQGARTRRAVATLARLCRHAPMAFSGETKAMKYFTHVDSPLGTMLLVSNGSSLTGLYFIGQKYVAQPSADWIQSEVTQPFPDAKRQLDEYFAGERRVFDLPLSFEGTPFQQRVWRAIASIDLPVREGRTSRQLLPLYRMPPMP